MRAATLCAHSPLATHNVSVLAGVPIIRHNDLPVIACSGFGDASPPPFPPSPRAPPPPPHYSYGIQIMPNAQDLCGRGTIDPIPSSATSYVYAQGSRAGLIPPEYGQTDGSLPGCRQFADDHSYSWTYNTWTSGVPSGCSWDGQNHVIYNRNLARAEEPMSPSSPYRRICLVELLPPPAAPPSPPHLPVLPCASAADVQSVCGVAAESQCSVATLGAPTASCEFDGCAAVTSLGIADFEFWLIQDGNGNVSERAGTRGGRRVKRCTTWPAWTCQPPSCRWRRWSCPGQSYAPRHLVCTLPPPRNSAQSPTPLVAATPSTASWNASPAAPARASPEQPAAAFSQAPASPVSLEPAAAAVPFVAAKPGPSAHGELCFRDGEDVRQQRPPAHDSE